MTGYSTFSQGRVTSYLNRLEDEINSGNTAVACDRLTNSVVFSFQDTSANPAVTLTGGRAELCEHFQTIALMYKTAPIADRHYKTDLSVKRHLLNWNTATVTYTEHHEIEYFPSRTKIRTKSKEQIVIHKKDDDFMISKWNIDVSF